jgi:hypothetical protein
MTLTHVGEMLYDMAEPTIEELQVWCDRSNVEWASMKEAELRFHEARSTGGQENILAAADELIHRL